MTVATVQLEDYLADAASRGPLRIVGGSPLYTQTFDGGISINGTRNQCDVAAINSSGRDLRRARSNGFNAIIMPRPVRGVPDGVIAPSKTYNTPTSESRFQPTTYFALLVICDALHIAVDLWGVCGWATHYHDGDWEMHWIKTRMGSVTVHDPRPKW